MKEKYLVINAGSSSLKFSLYDMPEANEIVNGYVEKIGKDDSFYTLKFNGEKQEKHVKIATHTDAVHVMVNELLDNNFIDSVEEIKGVGHRVVHGAEKYQSSALITDEVIQDIVDMSKFAPLHHPGNLAGIQAMQEVLPEVPMVAVYDTAFHQTMPIDNYLYAVPYQWYEENGVRKYGFHGTSHKYITEKMKEYYGKEDVNLIVCHIGSGASISCIKDGKCYDTTMGLTPLDGLVMGTRSGAIDPSIIEFICKERNLSVQEVTNILNKESGLLGIAGQNDFRDLENLAKSGDKNATVAIKMLKNSIIKYIAQYYFELDGNVDALVFTAGIGENAIGLRADIVNSISNAMSISLNSDANNNIAKFKEQQFGVITNPESKFDVMVMPTNEEYMILKDTLDISKSLETNNQLKKVRK